MKVSQLSISSGYHLNNSHAVIEYFDHLPSQRVLPTVQPGYLRPQLPDEAPQHGEEWSRIQADIESKIKPGLTHWQSPNFMAFYPANVSYPSILGEMYSAAFTAPAFNWLCSPACTELETIVMDWLCRALALPECFLSTSDTRGGGVIQVSASDAIAAVTIAARERRVNELVIQTDNNIKQGTPEYEDRVMELRPRLVALGSDQTHSSTAKAALIAGTRYRTISTRLEDNMEMTGAALRKVLEQCEKDRLIPYYITLSMGTTSTCALDRFAEITAVLDEKPSWRSIWVHVDAAYAGSALILPEWQHIAQQFAQGVDSFNMNMHKWLLVNFDAGYESLASDCLYSFLTISNDYYYRCLFVRNRSHLTSALDITPIYLRNHYSDTEQVIDYRNWQISLGRRFRALKIWFVMRSYGIDGMQAHIRKSITLGDVFADLVRSRSDLFELLTRPAFGLTVLRVKRQSESADADSSLTTKVSERINSDGQIFVTFTKVAGVGAIRFVNGNIQGDEAHIRRAFDILTSTTEDVIRQSS